MESKRAPGHLLAVITVLIWGTTFISTKVLLRAFAPVEILFFRFVLGLAVLFVMAPRRLRLAERRQERLFAAAGLCGITLYYLLENIALTYTSASNVGIIVTMSPFFTALLARRFLAAEKPGAMFFVGFAAAITGVGLITFNGSVNLELNPLGDLLSLAAAFTWSCYSILTRKIGALGYPTILTTRRIFCYGLAFMLPALLVLGFAPAWALLREPVNLLNVLYLGVGASAICFVTWNSAVRVLGAVKCSVYIYLVPVITVVTSVIVLDEAVTWMAAAGTALALAGLVLSDYRPARRRGAPGA